jgi:glutamyl-tRNA synthetase
MVNYLARLGWSHGDDEIFSRAQFLQWFNLDHLGRSAVQFDDAKLRWVNAQHLKAQAGDVLAPLVQTQLTTRGIQSDARLPKLCDLLKDRCDTTVALADWVARFYADVHPSADELALHVTEAIKPAVQMLSSKLAHCVWDKAGISAAIKEVLTATSIKMPQLAMPVRVLVMGTAQTPSLDAVLELCSREIVIARLTMG